MEHVFKVPRRDSKGNIVKDENGVTIFDEYVYNFDLMGADRMLSGRKLFHISNKEFKDGPKTLDELEALVTREAERQAFAAILMKKNDDGFERYDPYKLSSFDALRDITGKENFHKLLECQLDFFPEVGLQSPELMMQSLDITNQTVNILKTYKELEAKTGLGLQEVMLNLINGLELSQEKKIENNSIT